jgi:hypothetical protein
MGLGGNFISLPMGSGNYNFQLTDRFCVRAIAVKYLRTDGGWIAESIAAL